MANFTYSTHKLNSTNINSQEPLEIGQSVDKIRCLFNNVAKVNSDVIDIFELVANTWGQTSKKNAREVSE